MVRVLYEIPLPCLHIPNAFSVLQFLANGDFYEILSVTKIFSVSWWTQLFMPQIPYPSNGDSDSTPHVITQTQTEDACEGRSGPRPDAEGGLYGIGGS